MPNKDKSAFDDLIAARRSLGHLVSQSPNHPLSSQEVVPNEKVTKSKDVNYTRLTFYIRKDTDMQVRQKLLEEGKRELSDVFQKLAQGWVEGRFDV